MRRFIYKIELYGSLKIELLSLLREAFLLGVGGFAAGAELRRPVGASECRAAQTFYFHFKFKIDSSAVDGIGGKNPQQF